MLHNITGIDHALVGVHDLEAARVAFEGLGFTVTPRGSHIGWGTANYCVMFEDNYIELLGVVDPSLETNGLDTTLADRGEGLLGVALASDSPDATHSSLVGAGLRPSDLLDLKRKLELPEGDVLPRFKLIRIGAEGLSEKHLFICHHLTPELLRRPEWLAHANGARHIASVVFVVENPALTANYYRRLFGSIHVTVTDDTVTVRTAQGNLIFVNDVDLDMLFPGLSFAEELPPSPHPFAMTIGVKDLTETSEYFKGTGITPQAISNGSLRIDPKYTAGVLLEFVQA